MASMEEWVVGHEDLCAERYDGLKNDMRWLIRGVFGMLIGIVAWLGVQLWNGQKTATAASAAAVATNSARIGALEHQPPVTVVQSQSQP